MKSFNKFSGITLSMKNKKLQIFMIQFTVRINRCAGLIVSKIMYGFNESYIKVYIE